MGEGEKDSTSDDGKSGSIGNNKDFMDLKECIQDSPNFRLQLRSKEKEINELEMKLEKVVSTCDRMVTTGNSYTEACRSFSMSVKELSSHFKDTEVVTVSLRKFYEALSELQTYYSILFDQAQRSVQSSLRAYLSGELRKVKETKKTFHRVSDELKTAINRNGHAPKSKPLEAEEASAHLVTVQNQFSHHAIDYGYQINTVSCNKGYEILHSLLAFMHSQFTFFHQGYDLLHEFDPFMKEVAGKVDIMRKDAAMVVKEMETRHSLVSPKNLEDGSINVTLSPMENPSQAIEMSGYLFKRPQGNKLMFKSWSRRWFLLKTNKLVYQSESKAEEHVIVAEDLRICTVKLAVDMERRFCFEVVTPSRSCMLQADSEMLRKKWLAYLEAGIARALRISASNKTTEDLADFKRRSVNVSKGMPIHPLTHSPTDWRSDTAQSNYSLGIDFLEVPGNSECADCSFSKPTWASINLGIMLCIECSGIHRGLGVHISKVRSVTLDDWEPELQKIMCALGNTRVNAIYEYEIPKHVKKPAPESSRSVKETFIKLKYTQHAFVHPHPDFKRPLIPIPPLSIPDLLAPSTSSSPSPKLTFSGPSSWSPHGKFSSSASPRSPHGKRSFSPAALKLRSSRSSAIPRFSRPSSASSNTTDVSSLTGSDEDLRRVEITQSCDPASSLHLLAENFSKMEREKAAIYSKGVGGGGGGGGGGRGHGWGISLGDKIKMAKKSSKKISSYAKSKLGEGQESLIRRWKKTPKDSHLRDAHSDTEEDTGTSSTPLLFSMSASTQNLSSSSLGSASTSTPPDKAPPPKPPRTFKTKQLKDLLVDDSDEDGFDTDPILQQEGGPGLQKQQQADDDFSMNVLTAIKEVGVAYSLDVAKMSGSVGNGHITESFIQNGNGNHIIRSESSPQLTIKVQNGNGNGELETTSPRLHTISEDNIDLAEEITNNNSNSISLLHHSSVSCPAGSSATTPVSLLPLPQAQKDDRLVQSVPLRRKMLPLSPNTSADDSDISLMYPSGGSDVFSPTGNATTTTSGSAAASDSLLNKRFSILSTTSAEYFSAESSEGSKSDSLSPSPELIIRSASFPLSPSSQCGGRDDVISSMSIDDESFNTPPSSPFMSSVVICSTYSDDFATLRPGHVTGMDRGSSASENSGLFIEERDGEVIVTVQEKTKEEEKEEGEALEVENKEGKALEEEKEEGEALEEVNEEGEEPLTPTQSTPKHNNRTRSQTVSESSGLFGTLPVRGRKSQKNRASYLVSKDDNFQTEFKADDDDVVVPDEPGLSYSDGMSSYFSQKDLEDIFTVGNVRKEIISPPQISTVKEGDEEEEEREKGEEELEGSVNQGENAEEVEELSENPDLETSSVSQQEEEVMIIPDTVTPDMFLYGSIGKANFAGILCALAHGANANFVNTENGCKTPVLHAIEMGSKELLEYLYQNGGKLLASDSLGRGSLHLAAMCKDASLVMMLLKKGASIGQKDKEGKDPIDYALERESGDIVSMLRVASLRAEAKNGSDDRQSQYQELESEFFRDLEVATIVDSDRISKHTSMTSLEGSSSTASRDSKELPQQ